ncbi:Disease resistance protein L6 [Linum perenne]
MGHRALRSYFLMLSSQSAIISSKVAASYCLTLLLFQSFPSRLGNLLRENCFFLLNCKRKMEHMLKHYGEGTTVSNASLQSQTSSTEQQSVGSVLEYEVFLSFRGPDVRKSFADCLYSYLVRSKIRTFRDEEELRKGETIAPSLVQAITESKVYIPILSKSYASSKWCLQELAKMVECSKKEKGHIILPVFYFVDPRDVRHQAGPYEEAFEQHSKKHGPIVVQEWRTALEEVGQMKGWHVTEIDGQGAVIDQIFSKVELHLRSNYTLVNEELVGVDFHVQEVVRLLNLDSGDGKVVGIHGIGGMGKTTIAKAVYDSICTKFSRCCFLENIGEMLSKNDGIVAIQKSGIRTLVLRSLIKIDERNQFWMHDLLRDLGRAIVIEEDVKNPRKRSRIWSNEDAWNMLKNVEGTDQVEMLRIDMGDDSNLKFTEETFEKLAGLKYLDLAYCTLTGDFSRILPDIRWLRLHKCRSIPTDLNLKKVVILDLQGCLVTDDWRGWSGIQVAHKLKVINLHGCHKLNKVPNLVQCESLQLIDLTYCFGMRGELHIGSFRNLEVVRLTGTEITDLTGDLGKLQKLQEIKTGKLVWRAQEIVLPTSTKCLNISSPKVPNLLELKDLEELSFMECDAAPEIPGDIWQLTKLKILKLYKCNCSGSLLLDEEGALPSSLYSLIIRWCWGLYRLPNLANLNSLTELRMINVRVTQIHGLGELKVLEVLEISNSTSLYNLDGLENLVHLKELTLKNCGSLKNLPSLSNLIKLHSLVIIQCTLLSDIRGLGDLRRSLLNLEVSGCGCLANIEGLESLEALESLILESVKLPPFHVFSGLWQMAMREDEDVPQNFRQYHSPVKQFPDLSPLRNLKKLYIMGWRQLPEVTGIESLISLKSLVMTACKSLRRLPDLSGLKNLENLDVKGCIRLVDVTGLGRLESLQRLNFSSCWSLEELPDISGLKNLEKLDVSECTELIKVTCLEKLEKLQELRMVDCKSIKELPDISGLKNLEELDVSECTELIKVTGLEKLEKLQELRMEDCKSIKELPDLSGLKNLKILNLKGCKKLKNVKGLEELDHLWLVSMDKRLTAKYLLKVVVWAGRELARSAIDRTLRSR